MCREFKVGDKVCAPLYGRGVVEDEGGDLLFGVRYEDGRFRAHFHKGGGGGTAMQTPSVVCPTRFQTAAGSTSLVWCIRRPHDFPKERRLS